MGAMRRIALTVLLAVIAACAAAPAQAASRDATDHLAGLRFSLVGKRLTLKLTGKQQAAARVRGKRIRVSCASAAANKPNSPLVARGSAVWGRRSSSRGFTLSRDVSAKAKWCMVQTTSTIVSYVDLQLGRNPREGTSA
jgi:hypothetical protein